MSCAFHCNAFFDSCGPPKLLILRGQCCRKESILLRLSLEDSHPKLPRLQAKTVRMGVSSRNLQFQSFFANNVMFKLHADHRARESFLKDRRCQSKARPSSHESKCMSISNYMFGMLPQIYKSIVQRFPLVSHCIVPSIQMLGHKWSIQAHLGVRGNMVLTGVDPHCDLHGFLAEVGNPTAHASQCRSLAASRPGLPPLSEAAAGQKWL